MNGSGYEAEVVTMLQLKVRMLMFLGLAAIWAATPMVCQESGAHEERIIKVPKRERRVSARAPDFDGAEPGHRVRAG
jgi:hypothetical protein